MEMPFKVFLTGSSNLLTKSEIRLPILAPIIVSNVKFNFCFWGLLTFVSNPQAHVSGDRIQTWKIEIILNR